METTKQVEEEKMCMRCDHPRGAHIDHSYCPTQDKEAIENALMSEDPTTLELLDTYQDHAYVSAYRVDQCYGGPQEGGWWYDAGYPLESVRVDSAKEREATLTKLRKHYELDGDGRYMPADPECPDRERLRGRTSCAGGYDVELRVEFAFATPYPTARPRYE